MLERPGRTECSEALMDPRVNANLVLAAGDPHQATVIAQVMLQGSLISLLEKDSRGSASRLEASANQLIPGLLAGIIELDQSREALLETAGRSIGQSDEL